VGRQRGQVDVHRPDVEGDLAEPLHGVGVKEHVSRAAGRADLDQREDRADLVVREHERDEHGLVPDCRGDRGRFDPAGPVGGQVRHLEPLPLQNVAGVEHRVVLGCGGHDVVPLRP
jgi:hypothetical protein